MNERITIDTKLLQQRLGYQIQKKDL